MLGSALPQAMDEKSQRYSVFAGIVGPIFYVVLLTIHEVI